MHRRGAFIPLSGIFLSPFFAQTARAESEEIETALLLMADVSGSMDFRGYPGLENSVPIDFFRFQMRAYAGALQEPCVRQHLIGEPGARTAVGVVVWSGREHQEIIIPWTTLRNESDVDALAQTIDAFQYQTAYATAIGDALWFGIEYFENGAVRTAPRKIIDISGNGRTNVGRDPREARDRAERLDITINGIVTPPPSALVERLDSVRDHYENFVRTRNGFVLAVPDGPSHLERFTQSMVQKLCMELA